MISIQNFLDLGLDQVLGLVLGPGPGPGAGPGPGYFFLVKIIELDQKCVLMAQYGLILSTKTGRRYGSGSFLKPP